MKSKLMFKVMGLLLCLVLFTSQAFAAPSAPLNDDYVELTVLNPISAVEAVGEYAPRLNDLNGKNETSCEVFQEALNKLAGL